MDQNLVADTSLLGALLVAEGLLAPEQLAACLLLQKHDYSDLHLGQILLRCGYVSRESLEHALELQRTMRESLSEAVDRQVPIPADLSVLVIARCPSDVLTTMLARHGAAVRYCRAMPDDLAAEWPDLVLIEAGRLESCAALPDGCPVELLPDIGRYMHIEAVPPSVRRLVERYVLAARAWRAQQREAEEGQQRELELRAIAMMTRALTQAQDAQQLLGQLMVLVRDLLSVEAATLFRVDARSERLVFELVLGPNQKALEQQTLPLGHGIVGWVVQHGEPLIIPDVRRDERFAGSTDRSTGFHTRSMLCVPMRAFGKTEGVLQLINKQDGEFTELDLELLRLVAAFGATALAARPSAAPRQTVLRERVMAATM